VYLRERRPAREWAQGAARDLYTLLLTRPDGNCHSNNEAEKQYPIHHCYHSIEVKPESIGRVLGIGMRVAGRMAGQRIMGEASTAVAAVQATAERTGAAVNAAAPQVAARTRTAGKATGGIARGLSGFFQPFRRVGGKIWLEVTGVFFLLPVVVFAPTIWRTRASWAYGADHRTFVSASIVVAVFLYLGVTSFWRAHKR
jgi:hypothetical protein